MNQRQLRKTIASLYARKFDSAGEDQIAPTLDNIRLAVTNMVSSRHIQRRSRQYQKDLDKAAEIQQSSFPSESSAVITTRSTPMDRTGDCGDHPGTRPQ